jgi:hypothetical protein
MLLVRVKLVFNWWSFRMIGLLGTAVVVFVAAIIIAAVSFVSFPDGSWTGAGRGIVFHGDFLVMGCGGGGGGGMDDADDCGAVGAAIVLAAM